jgi:hypothetical protein
VQRSLLIEIYGYDKNRFSAEWISLDRVQRFPVSATRRDDRSSNTGRFSTLKPIKARAKTEHGVKFQAGLPTPYKWCEGSVDVSVPCAHIKPFQTLMAPATEAQTATQKEV